MIAGQGRKRKDKPVDKTRTRVRCGSICRDRCGSGYALPHIESSSLAPRLWVGRGRLFFRYIWFPHHGHSNRVTRYPECIPHFLREAMPAHFSTVLFGDCAPCWCSRPLSPGHSVGQGSICAHIHFCLQAVTVWDHLGAPLPPCAISDAVPRLSSGYGQYYCRSVHNLLVSVR